MGIHVQDHLPGQRRSERLVNIHILREEDVMLLKGETTFIGAFTNFYLINVYGDAPLVLTTDYEANSQVSRTPKQEI